MESQEHLNSYSNVLEVSMKTFSYTVEGIDCKHCAKELEEEIGKLEGISNCVLEFGHPSHLSYEYEGEDPEGIEKKMIQIIEDDQENPVITPVEHHHEHEECHCHDHHYDEEECHCGHEHHHHHEHEEECCCGHEHHHEHGEECCCGHEHHHDHHQCKHEVFTIEGIDCANCAKELEEEIGKLDGVTNCILEFGIHSHLQYDVEIDKADVVEKSMIKIIEDDQENPIITRVIDHNITHVEYVVDGIDCANCARELEEEIGKLDGVTNCTLEFGIHSHLKYDVVSSKNHSVEQQMIKIIEDDQENPVIKKISDEKEKTYKFNIKNIDCADCANELAEATTKINGVKSCDADFMNQLLIVKCNPKDKSRIASEMKDMIAKAEPEVEFSEYVKEKKKVQDEDTNDKVMLTRMIVGAALFASSFLMNDIPQIIVSLIAYLILGYDVLIKAVRGMGRGQLFDEHFLMAIATLAAIYQQEWEEAAGVMLFYQIGEYFQDLAVRRSRRSIGELMDIRPEYAILDLVENNDSHKAEHEKFITKFSKYYTPIVVFLAIAVAIFVGVFIGDFNEGIRRACTFLVISCPCALVISIPLSFFAGIGGLSSRGVLVKGANIIDDLAKVKQVVMDKTGTLTSGEFAVEEVFSVSNEDTLIYDAACAEHFSNHPIAQGIKNACNQQVEDADITDVQEIAGRGLSVKLKGVEILAGNYKLMQDKGIVCEQQSSTGTLVYVAKNGVYEGCLILRDQLKKDSKEAIDLLQKEGKKCIIVSGDNQEITEAIGKQLHVDQAIGGCMPEDKVNAVKNFMKEGKTAFVGDGVNDAPVITLADVGIAMGALGSDAAIEAADVVLMDDSPSKISLAISASKRILFIANENIYGAITIKVLTLIFGALGIANMWWAIFADTGVAMLCVLNSLRLLKISRK